jgi:hypothetical protein
MSDVKIGDYVDIGGAVGKVTDLKNNWIKVEGTYHYPDGAEGAFAENYQMWFENTDDIKWDDEWKWWKI